MNDAPATCKCFNINSCNARRAKGLVPFCEMDPAAVPLVADGTFGSLEDARAAYPGRRVSKVSGGLLSGSPVRFGLAWSEYAR